MRLYSGPLSMFGMKAEIAAREKGLEFDLVMVPFDMDRLYEPKHPDVARINPNERTLPTTPTTSYHLPSAIDFGVNWP